MNLDLTQLIAIAAALGWASGLRLYAVVFITGAGRLARLGRPAGRPARAVGARLLGASGLMLFIEFFVDKIPGLDSVWDAIHTFVRIPAGAALAAAVFGGDQASWVTAAALLGGSLAATSHAAKATTRAVGQHLARAVLEHRPVAARRRRVPVDALARRGSHPVVALVVLAAVVVVSLVIVWVLWRFIARLIAAHARRLRRPSARRASAASRSDAHAAFPRHARRRRPARRPAEREADGRRGGQDRARAPPAGGGPARDRGHQLRQPEVGAADGRQRRRPRRHRAQARASATRCWCRT